MKTALIITTVISDEIRVSRSILDAEYDMIICCDGGLDRAAELGIRPDILLGDFDSAEHFSLSDAPGGCEGAQNTSNEESVEDTGEAELLVLPHEKDVTDTEAAVDLAYDRGARVITIIGGLGGRLDHTLANLGLLAKYLGDADIFIIDGDNFVRMLAPGKHRVIGAGYEYLGLIPFGGPVRGLSISNVKYPAEGIDIDGTASLTVSNEITEDPAVISFSSGRLLVIQSNDVLRL